MRFCRFGIGLGTTKHARIYPLLSAAVLVVAFLVVARAADRQARQHYVDLWFDAKQSRDMRGISNPFSTVNLAAWLFPSESRNARRRRTIDPRGPRVTKHLQIIISGHGATENISIAAAGAAVCIIASAADAGQGEEEKKEPEAPPVKPPPAVAKKPRRFATLQSWQIDYERLRVVAKIGAVLPGKCTTASSWARAWRSSSLFSSFIDPSELG